MSLYLILVVFKFVVKITQKNYVKIYYLHIILNIIGLYFLICHANLEGFTLIFAKAWLHNLEAGSLYIRAKFYQGFSHESGVSWILVHSSRFWLPRECKMQNSQISPPTWKIISHKPTGVLWQSNAPSDSDRMCIRWNLKPFFLFFVCFSVSLVFGLVYTLYASLSFSLFPSLQITSTRSWSHRHKLTRTSMTIGSGGSSVVGKRLTSKLFFF